MKDRRIYKRIDKRTDKRKFIGLITAIGMVIIFSGISIFKSDAHTLNDSNGGSMDITSDSEYIYLTYKGSWSNYIQQTFDIAVNGQAASGALSKLVINTGNDGEGSSFSVLNGWYQAIDGASGYTQNSEPSSSGWGYENMTWSAKIPVSTYGTDVSDMTIGWNGSIASLIIDNGKVTTEATTETGSEVTTEDKKNDASESTAESEATTEGSTTESTEEEVTEEKTTEQVSSEEKTTETKNTEQVSTEEKTTETETTEQVSTEEKTTETETTERVSTEEKTTETETTERVSTEEKTTETETTEQVSTEEKNIDTNTTESATGPVTSGLVIDGYYGEWSQYPSADITYSSNNGYSVHKGQLAVENGRLYVHFSMNDLYTSQMQFHLWKITVNGKECVLNILPVNADGSINWSGQTTGLSEGIHRDFGVFAGYYNDVDGDVAFTVYDTAHTETGKGDEIEFSISLEKLAAYLGINIDQGATITVSNPNIGAEGVTITGTPTGPWAGAAMAMALATGGVFAFRRKKREIR